MAQRQRAAAAAAAAATHTAKMATAASSLAGAASASGTVQQNKQSGKQQSNTTESSQKHPRRDSSAKAETSEESNFSDEDSEEDETAAAFEMDGQELWTQNYCATCDCLIEPGQGVGAKKEEQQPMHSPTSSISRSSGLKSKSGTIKARPLSSEGSSNGGNMKRTHSAGKLHAAGAAGPLGPHKRTGSAAGRLNALSELRPTTKLNGEINRPKATGETSQGKRSPGLPRRDSGVSDVSNGGNSANSSRPASPVSSNHVPSARSKKNRVTIAQAEEDIDENKMHAAPALYCSERCQQIDEQRSSGLGELVYYLHQPVSPSASNWSANGHSNSYNSWSSRNLVMANRNGNNVPGTPESECYCPECMDKNSASGTVPSGASDTTESSVGFPYGQGGRKQRTQSGRIMTPQGLIAPGGHGNDYFGIIGPGGQRKSVSKASQRGAHATDTTSQNGSTENSALSSESAVSELWEPHIRPNRQSTLRSPKTTRESQTSNVSDEASYGAATTGTVTPAATIGSPRRAESPFAWHGSQTAAASPLRLLRQGDHHSHPSVDVTSDYAQSPQAASGFLSRSMASENTELGASSGLTVAGLPSQPSSLLERRRETSEAARLVPARMTNSPMPMEVARTTSAIGTLKNAQSRAMSEVLSQASRDDRRQSTGGSSTASSTNSGWLRSSISSAWNTIRGLPTSTSTTDIAPAYNRGAEEGTAVSKDTGLPTIGALTLEDTSSDPTPKQSQIARPKTTRGDIPAFASEIGHGSIPGEEEGGNRRSVYSTHDDRLSKSYASAHGSIDEERRRRKSEKERAQRHQRSKDITVLPPLLGVSRTSSGINLQAHSKSTRPHHSHHSSTASLTGMNNRNRAGSHGQQTLYSGSFGQLSGLIQPPTPGLRPNHGGNGRMTPSIELGSSPSRMMSASSLGTSPRRGGLGWGAMTAIASPDAAQTTFAPARPSSHASHRHRHHPSSGSSTRLHHHSSGSSNGSSNNNLVVLGHVGQLGFHPHGHGPIYGRHATTPVRSTTPRVPEDGGEMSGAALKGEGQDDAEKMYSHSQRRSSLAPPIRPRSGMNMRRQSDMPPPSNVKRNSAGLSPLIQQTSLDSESTTPVKMYPVLDIPNRQPTHDRYDTNWLVSGVDEALKDTEQQHKTKANRLQPPDNQASNHRKRLFYFDTT